jgi:hypothetical protein
LLGPIYRALEGWVSLPLSNFLFAFYRVEVSHKLFSIPIIKRGREGGDLSGSVVNLLELNEKFDSCTFSVLFVFPVVFVMDLDQFHISI